MTNSGFRCTLLVALLALVAGIPARAASFERRLIPLAVGGKTGNFGTVWYTTVTVVSETVSPTEIVGLVPTRVPPGYSGSFPRPGIIPATESSELPGSILYVPSDSTSSVHVTAILDERSNSPRPSTRGNGIPLPVVRETEFSNSTIYFLDLRKKPGTRTLLRVYSLDLESGTPSVRVRIQAFYEPFLNPGPWDITYDREFPLGVTQRTMSDSGGSVTLPVRPLAMELPIDSLLASFPDGGEFAVSVVPSGDLKIWAMLSETNNTSQGVTLRLPD